MEYRLTAPMTREQARQLRCGDTVLFTGTIYTARDAAHKRLVELLDKPEQIRIRAPMVIREIHYLLLAGPQGESLRQLRECPAYTLLYQFSPKDTG